MSSVDIGIDLGTANIIIVLGNKGIIINEPSVIAYDKKKKQVIAVGNEAYAMLGRTPEYIVAVKPLEDGVISDNDMTQLLLGEFIKKVSKNMLVKPQIILCVPSSVTDVESRAVIEAALSAGARKVYLIQEPIAALIGAGVDISKPSGTMVADIGGGTTDIAIVSFSGIVQSRSIKMGGNRFDDAIVKYVSNKCRILIGNKSAENIKKTIANVYNPEGKIEFTIKGRHLISGLPQTAVLTDIDIFNALSDNIMEIIAGLKEVLESTPPELVGDILVSGIVLTGGGALLKGLPELISKHIGVPCLVADNAIECVARGIEKAFLHIDELRDGFEKVSLYRYK